jgi:hypothetical protein
VPRASANVCVQVSEPVTAIVCFSIAVVVLVTCVVVAVGYLNEHPNFFH